MRNGASTMESYKCSAGTDGCKAVDRRHRLDGGRKFQVDPPHEQRGDRALRLPGVAAPSRRHRQDVSGETIAAYGCDWDGDAWCLNRRVAFRSHGETFCKAAVNFRAGRGQDTLAGAERVAVCQHRVTAGVGMQQAPPALFANSSERGPGSAGAAAATVVPAANSRAATRRTRRSHRLFSPRPAWPQCSPLFGWLLLSRYGLMLIFGLGGGH